MKDSLTLDAQLQHLVEERGLDLGELSEDEAICHLASLNYYRLKGYWLTLEKNEKFIEGTKFQDILDILWLDSRIRNLLYNPIPRQIRPGARDKCS